MSEKNFIEMNKQRFHEIIQICLNVIQNSLLPQLILTVVNVKRMATLFGYSNFMDFLNEDDDVLSEKLEKADPETRMKLEALYETIAQQCMHGIEETEETMKLTEEGDINQNILDIMDPNWDSEEFE